MNSTQQPSHTLGTRDANPTQPPAPLRVYCLLTEGAGMEEFTFRKVPSINTSQGKPESTKQLKERLVQCLQATATLARVSQLEFKTSRAPWGTVSTSSY